MFYWAFLDFDFFENKANTTHFNITLEEIEKVFKLIDKNNGGLKITLDELKTKMKVFPFFPYVFNLLIFPLQFFPFKILVNKFSRSLTRTSQRIK